MLVRQNTTTAWAYVAGIALVAHRPGKLGEEDFAQFHADVVAQQGIKGIVISAHDSPPPPGQRAAIARWFRDTQVRGAVLTDALLARGGVTALSWLGVPIRAFPRAEVLEAFAFVGVPADQVAPCQALLSELMSRVAERVARS